jgi:hypothetical protein
MKKIMLVSLILLLLFLPVAQAEMVEVSRTVKNINNTVKEVELAYNTSDRIVGLIIIENLPDSWKVIDSKPPYSFNDGEVKWLIKDPNGIKSGVIKYQVKSEKGEKITGEWKAIHYNGSKFEGEIQDLTTSSPQSPGFSLIAALMGFAFLIWIKRYWRGQ